MKSLPKETVTRHMASSRQYLENAVGLLRNNEPHKAGEMLWGAISQALHAVAASRGIPLTTHKSLRHFVSSLVRERSDQDLATTFRAAESLHSDFYEVELEVEDVGALTEPIRRAVANLMSLIPQELRSASA